MVRENTKLCWLKTKIILEIIKISVDKIIFWKHNTKTN